jgi:sulfate permease, SulP family
MLNLHPFAWLSRAELGRRRIRVPRGDIVAGVSVASVLVPQAVAYAHIAGLPPIRGLYASAFPPIAAARFASSPYLQPGPTAITALLTFGALSSHETPGTLGYIEAATMLALLVGLFRLAIGTLRAGAIAYLLSEPVLIGFVPAAAILIVASQVGSLFGASASNQNQLVAAAAVLRHADNWKPGAVGFAVSTLILLSLRRLAPAATPIVLCIVVGAAAVSVLAGYGGATVGHIPAGLPPLTIDFPVEHVRSLALPALVIAVIGFAEAASIGRTYATMDRARWDSSREFIGQGVANLAAAVTGGFPVGASFSRSALNRMAGAVSNASAVVTGATVLAVIPIAGLLAPLPMAVLAAVVVASVIPLLSPQRILRLARVSRIQLLVALSMFALTLAEAPHLDHAILLGVVLSIAVHLWRELRISVEAQRKGDVLELRPEGVLWFGTVQVLDDRLTDALAQHTDARTLTLDLSHLGRIDVSAAMALEHIVRDAHRAGLSVSVRGGPSSAWPLLTRVFGTTFVPRASD